MLGKTKLSSFLLLALLIVATASTSWATCPPSGGPPTDNTYSGTGPITNTTMIAVASNFKGPVIALLQTYFLPAYPQYAVEVCSDSTGNFENIITPDINNNNPIPYSMFFAADSTPTSLYGPNGTVTQAYGPYLYAKGVPALFGYLPGNASKTISGPTDLVAGLNVTDITANSAGLHNTYTISSTLTGGTKVVAIANPAKAPYGQAAENILNAMEPIYGSSYYVTPSSQTGNATWTSIEPWIVSPLTTYSNITNTFNAVGTAVPAGFVAKAQICSHVSDGTIAWVEFGSTDFQPQQTAVLFNASDPVGNALNSFITGWMVYHPPMSKWDQFLSANCYKTF